MAYPAGYWAELVRSSSQSVFTPAADGGFVWLRTNDGLPLEQEIRAGGSSWVAVADDTGEPDYLADIRNGLQFRFRKTGEAWLPSDDGIEDLNTIDWPGRGIYRFVTVGAPSFGVRVGAALTGVAGVAIADVLVPAAENFPVPAYTASGLPAGLQFDANTRTISGTPSAEGSGTITITARNVHGTSTRTYEYAFQAAGSVAPTVEIASQFGGALSANYAEAAGSIFLSAVLTGGNYVGSPSLAWTLEAGSGRVVPFGSNRAIYAITNILEADSPETVRIRCTATVTNSEGVQAVSFGEATFTVTASTAPPRVVINTAAQRILAGATLQLQATVTDPQGFIAGRAWTAADADSGSTADIGGFANAAVEDARWTAPRADGVLISNYALTLTATDDDGRTAAATVLIEVLNVQPLEGRPVAGDPTARAQLGGPLTFAARAAAEDPTAEAELGGPLTFSARPSAGAPSARGRSLAPFSAKPAAGAPTARAAILYGFRDNPSAGVPTARAQLATPLDFAATASAGAPTAFARILAPLTGKARSGAPAARARLFGPLRARPFAGIPKAIFGGFYARPFAGIPTARAQLAGTLSLAARARAGIPVAAARLLAPLLARAAAGRPTALARVLAPFLARAAAREPAAAARVLAPLAGEANADAPAARARFPAPVTFAARPSAGVPMARGILTQPLEGYPRAGRPTARAGLDAPITFRAHPFGAAPTAIFSEEMQELPVEPPDETGGIMLPDNLTRQYQPLSRPDLAHVLRTIAGAARM